MPALEAGYRESSWGRRPRWNVRFGSIWLEQENPTEEPAHEQKRVSTTDPDATYATKSGPARLGYYDNYLVDNRSCVIVGVQATAARLRRRVSRHETWSLAFPNDEAAHPSRWPRMPPIGNGEFLQWLLERGITPYMRIRDNALRKNTTGQYKYLAIHIHEPARQRARELAQTPAFANSQRERRKVEALFAELKNEVGLRRLRLRRLKFVREQFFLAAAAQKRQSGSSFRGDYNQAGA
jgi:Transposase DDE domain